MTATKSVCVYCSSSDSVPDSFKTAARNLGSALGKNGLNLVYGGSARGLMGIVADAALNAGGRVYGVLPKSLRGREPPHPDITEIFWTQDMLDRKRKMADLSDAFVILPGGLGTLEEGFEILTAKQVGWHKKPVIFLNPGGFWDPLMTFFDCQVQNGVIGPDDLKLFEITDQIQNVMDILVNMGETGRVRAENSAPASV